MSGDTVRVTGAVATPLELRSRDLAAMPSVIDDVTTIAPGAVGRAVRVRDVLAEAGVRATATHCTVISSGGAYRASIPLDEVLSGGWLAFAFDDEPLPEHLGGPYRLTVADGATLCWNVKSVATLKITTGAEPDDVPANPTH